jgi:hypothetical protein
LRPNSEKEKIRSETFFLRAAFVGKVPLANLELAADIAADFALLKFFSQGIRAGKASGIFNSWPILPLR